MQDFLIMNEAQAIQVLSDLADLIVLMKNVQILMALFMGMFVANYWMSRL